MLFLPLPLGLKYGLMYSHTISFSGVTSTAGPPPPR